MRAEGPCHRYFKWRPFGRIMFNQIHGAILIWEASCFIAYCHCPYMPVCRTMTNSQWHHRANRTRSSYNLCIVLAQNPRSKREPGWAGKTPMSRWRWQGWIHVTSWAPSKSELRDTVTKGKQAPGFLEYEYGVRNSSKVSLTNKTESKILFKIWSPQYLLPDWIVLSVCVYRCVVYAQVYVHGWLHIVAGGGGWAACSTTLHLIPLR